MNVSYARVLTRLISILFLSFISMTRAQAASASRFEQDFKAMASKVVETAVANGWTEVGGIPLPYILTEIQKPRVYLNPENVSTNRGGRETAMCDGRFMTVHINPLVWREYGADEQAGIALHELICASGIEDHAYQYSLRIDIMAHEKALRDFPVKWEVARGGGTGVGGGGDGLDYVAKRVLYYYFANELDNLLHSMRAEEGHSRARNNKGRKSSVNDRESMERLKGEFLDLGVHVHRYELANESPTVVCGAESAFLELGMKSLRPSMESGEMYNVILRAITNNVRKKKGIGFYVGCID